MRLWLRGPDIEFAVIDDADDPHVYGAEGFGFSAPQQVQKVQRFRAPAIVSWGRGNVETTHQFEVRRELLTHDACIAYLMDKVAAVPSGGGLYAVWQGYDGTTRYLSDASLIVTRAQPNGVEAMITYQLSGGLWQRDNPILTT